MKSPILLWSKVAHELATWCHTSATRDVKTVSGRCEHEGFSFLTITLAAFGSDFQKSLDQGAVAHDHFLGFARSGGLPRFLGGFLERVFHRHSGVLRDDPCLDAIYAIRQLTLMFGKIYLDCSKERQEKSFAQFVTCEQEVRDSFSLISDRDWSDFRRISSLLFGSYFSKVDSDIYYGRHVPKHGPGATAERLSSNGRYLQPTWPRRLEAYFPSVDFILPSPSYWEALTDVDFLEPGAEIPVRVITVPKTLKTPRIIAIEPSAMQYAQQGVLEVLMRRLKEDDFLFGTVGFNDQTPNQRMAKQGSIHGDLATLDLSEASDRVSNQHVRNLLAPHPHLFGAVDACRSRKADVPGQGEVRLAKFASMGSALCFPMEAFVFTTLVFVGIERALNTTLTRRAVKAYAGSVRVFGDDIIIPVDMVDSVVSTLELFGARVNAGKSFWTGSFRESCGKDYYAGFDVTPVRVRRLFPTQRKHSLEVISLVKLRNHLYERGLWQTCEWLDGLIVGLLGSFPVVEPSSPVLGRRSFLPYQGERHCETMHRPLVRGYVQSSRSPSDPLDGYGALLKYFLLHERFSTNRDWVDSLPAVDEDHLERAGRPQRVDIKLRWATPY